MLEFDINKMIPMVARHYELELKVLGSDQDVYNFLEDAHYDGKAGEIVLRGTVGEEWIIPPKKLSKYMKLDGSDIVLDEMSPDTWISIQTRESNAVTWMIQIPVHQTGEIITERGDLLKVNTPGVPHDQGDWIACSNKDGKPYPQWGFWVVNGEVFKNTYQTLSSTL